ncbi:MAG: tetratricopeptide repeat protein [Sedimentisphaerales bacterium]|nr:tetratricopeptide repeat protein [Sedimentisphaerales bacterium]
MSIGCAPLPEQQAAEQTRAETPVPSPYAVVDPLELNANLAPDAIERMVLPYNDLPWQELAADIDPNHLDLTPLLSRQPGGLTRTAAAELSCNRQFPLGDDAQVLQVEEFTAEISDTADAVQHYLRARWMLNNGQRSQAIEAAQEGLAIDPNSAELWSLLGQAQYGLGRARDGAQSCRQALMLNNDIIEAYHYLAVEQLNAGNYQQAAVYLQRGLLCSDADRGNPITGYLEIQLGSTLDELGYTNAAATAYRRCYNVLREQYNYSHPDPAMNRFVRQIHLPLFAIASNNVHMGRIADAVSVLAEMLQWVPDDIDAAEAFVNLLVSQRISLPRRFAEVRAVCRYLLSISTPENERPLAGELGIDQSQVIHWFYNACEMMSKYDAYLAELRNWYTPVEQGGMALIAQHDYALGLRWAGMLDEAQDVLEDLASRGSDDPADDAAVLRDLAEIYAEQESHREMLASYGAYLELVPDAVEQVLADITQWQVRQDALAEQIAQWDAAEQLQSPGVVFLLGFLSERIGQLDDAERYYSESGQSFAPGRVRLIELLLTEHRYEEALALIENDLAIGQGQLLWYAGQACLGLGRSDEAARYYQEWIETHPDDVRAYVALGEVLRQEGQLQRAEQILLQVLARWPAEMTIHEQLLFLYCEWAGREATDDELAGAAELRAREMLQQWMLQMISRPIQVDGMERLRARGDEVIVPKLNELAQRYPGARVMPLILGEYYARTGREEEALAITEQALATNSEDVKLLERGVVLTQHLELYAESANYELALWNLREETVERLFDLAGALRRAERSDEAMDLLLGWFAEHDGCEELMVADYQMELMRLSLVTRRFEDAVELLEDWRSCLAESSVEADELDAELSGPEAVDVEGRMLSERAERMIWENLIWALTEAGQYERAQELVTQLYDQFDVEDSLGAMYLARSLWIRRRFDEAQVVLETLAALNSDSAAIHSELYLTMLDQGQASEAVTLAQQWAEEEPDSQQRKWLAAKIMREAGDISAAVNYLEAILADDQGHEALESLLVEILMRAGRFDEAEDVLTRAGLGDMLSGSRFEQRLWLYVAQGDCGAAEAHLATFAASLPEVQYAQTRAEILSSCGLADEAVEAVAALAESDPENTDLRLYYGMLLDRADRKDEALANLESVWSANPGSATLLNNLGYSLLEAEGDLDRAGELILRSFSLDPISSPTQDSVGWYYYCRGEYERALEYLYDAAAATMSGRDAEIFEHLGDVTYHLGRTEDALWYWQEAAKDLEDRQVIERYLEVDLERIREKLTRLRDETMTETVERSQDNELGSDR